MATTSSTPATSSWSHGFNRPLQGKENYIPWKIDIDTILLRNNNAAYIRNSLRAARPKTPHLDKYNYRLKQYKQELQALEEARVKDLDYQGRALAIPKKS